MPKKRFSDEQIAFALRQAEAGTTNGEICREVFIPCTLTHGSLFLSETSLLTVKKFPVNSCREIGRNALISMHDIGTDSAKIDRICKNSL